MRHEQTNRFQGCAGWQALVRPRTYSVGGTVGPNGWGGGHPASETQVCPCRRRAPSIFVRATVVLAIAVLSTAVRATVVLAIAVLAAAVRATVVLATSTWFGHHGRHDDFDWVGGGRGG